MHSATLVELEDSFFSRSLPASPLLEMEPREGKEKGQVGPLGPLGSTVPKIPNALL